MYFGKTPSLCRFPPVTHLLRRLVAVPIVYFLWTMAGVMQVETLRFKAVTSSEELTGCVPLCILRGITQHKQLTPDPTTPQMTRPQTWLQSPLYYCTCAGCCLVLLMVFLPNAANAASYFVCFVVEESAPRRTPPFPAVPALWPKGKHKPKQLPGTVPPAPAAAPSHLCWFKLHKKSKQRTRRAREDNKVGGSSQKTTKKMPAQK